MEKGTYTCKNVAFDGERDCTYMRVAGTYREGQRG